MSGVGQVKDGDRVVLPPEGLAKVQWQFNVKDIKKVTSRYWYFTSSDGTFDDEFLAQIDGDGTPVIKSKRLAGLKIEKPATLVLKNVNQSYNGSYVFHIVAGSGGSVSKVTVIIAGMFSPNKSFGFSTNPKYCAAMIVGLHEYI